MLCLLRNVILLQVLANRLHVFKVSVQVTIPYWGGILILVLAPWPGLNRLYKKMVSEFIPVTALVSEIRDYADVDFWLQRQRIDWTQPVWPRDLPERVWPDFIRLWGAANLSQCIYKALWTLCDAIPNSFGFHSMEYIHSSLDYYTINVASHEYNNVLHDALRACSPTPIKITWRIRIDLGSNRIALLTMFKSLLPFVTHPLITWDEYDILLVIKFQIPFVPK